MTELPLLQLAYIILLLLFLLPGGTFTCKLILRLTKVKALIVQSDSLESLIRTGKIIGHLERLLIFLGIIFSHWEILVIVVALKTLARYKELDVKINAEYFLIGSLTSILWAILVALIFKHFYPL